MFKAYRRAFKKTIEEDKSIWERLKWYEKVGVYIYGPVAYVSAMLKEFSKFPRDIIHRG